MVEYPTESELKERDFLTEAADIQDASNIVAVMGTLQNAARKARIMNIDPRNDMAVKAIFFKVYDMMGAPSEKEMYAASKYCEAIKSRD